jgi:hypothetical protein
VADIAKLDAALAYIEEHPEEWDQGNWGVKNPCGTAGCLAFHVGRLDGAPITWDRPPDTSRWAYVERIGGKTPSNYARDSLGLSDGQAAALFFEFNSLDELKTMRDRLAENPNIAECDLWPERTIELM